MPIDIREADGLRLLRFGSRWCQGAMRIAAPNRLELEYALRMCAWLLFHEPGTLQHKHLVTLGLGAGSLTKFAHGVLRMRATAVEIDAEVIDACRQHFHLPPDGGGLRVLHADAADYIAQPATAGSIDVLQVDAYDAAVDRPALDTEAFYAQCRTSLHPGGTLAVNLIGRSMVARASVARIRAGFEPRTLWQFPPTEAGNVVVIAHDGDEPPEVFLAQQAMLIQRRWHLPAQQWCAIARRAPPLQSGI
jgi:spermidine synthase